MPVMGGIEASKNILKLLKAEVSKNNSGSSYSRSKISKCLSSYLNSGIIENPKD